MFTRALFTVALGLSLGACQKAEPARNTDSKPAETQAAVRELSVSDVAALVQAKGATIVDANDAETRQEQGVVPGAVLLSSSRTYPLNELPAAKDTKLVFYCGGTACRASDNAAQRASEAGYADVSVMRAGIRGWKSAGQQTATPRS
ncbi:MAG TPA: rhodanese-like domain-containing protein [Polyangiaceae bacterium]|nr:rhodanese-like domain-containing protein [Polyangiaceae bacterium]